MPDGSRLALGATTVALVGLASAGTGLLISHGTKTLEAPPTALPSRSTVGHPPAVSGIVVPRVPGTFVAARRSPAPAARPVVALPALLFPALTPVVAPIAPGVAPVPPVPPVVPVVSPTDLVTVVTDPATWSPQTSRGWSRFSPAPSPEPSPTSGPVLQPSTSRSTTHQPKAKPAKTTKTKPAKTKPAKAHGKSTAHERPTTFSPRHDGR